MTILHQRIRYFENIATELTMDVHYEEKKVKMNSILASIVMINTSFTICSYKDEVYFDNHMYHCRLRSFSFDLINLDVSMNIEMKLNILVAG